MVRKKIKLIGLLSAISCVAAAQLGCDPGDVCAQIAPECDDGAAVDLDGDGCALECRGANTAEHALHRDEPTTDLPPVDGDEPTTDLPPVDGDEPTTDLPPVDGDEPTTDLPPVDGDGPTTDLPPVGDTVCPQLLADCPEPVDLNGDGCALECR